MTNVLIDSVGISKNFGERTALLPMSLKISCGDRLAVLGPNSAGKSTLLRLLSGLSRPSTGYIETANTGPSRLRKDLRGIVGYLGHSSMLYPALSPLENIEFSGRLYGIPHPKERRTFLLNELGLLEFKNERVGTLSSGVLRRVAIARALLHEPKVLLLDEPFAGLDYRSGEILEKLLSQISHSHPDRALVLVSHDLSGAARLTNNALFLSKGNHTVLGAPTKGDWSEAYRHAQNSLEKTE
ncbi:ABC transporter ATP-binding protein [Myxococcota bacterium]|nr:ABC transporter ATP-binding protein [Myxococcota bacterium]